jgi:hypothetical protein
MLTGTDLPAVAASVEKRTGIPCFGLKTNSMHSYISGASMAFEALAKRFCAGGPGREKGSGKVNVLGVTPLDFSVNGSDRSIRSWLEGSGFTVNSVWAMGSSLDEIIESGRADVNLVVSYDGLAAARRLRQEYGAPYVIGVPLGRDFSAALAGELARAADTGENSPACSKNPAGGGKSAVVIGESVYSLSLAAALGLERGLAPRVICPLETERALLRPGDCAAMDEDELIPLLSGAEIIIADPMYKPVCPAGCDFRSLPTEAFSGRSYRRDIPNLINKNIELERM